MRHPSPFRRRLEAPSGAWSRARRPGAWLAALALALVLAGVAGGQAANGPVALEPPAEIEQARLAERLAELAKLEDSGAEMPAAAAQELALLRETERLLRQGAEARAAAERFAAEARSAPEQAAQIDEYLAKPNEELVPAVDRAAPLDELNQQLEAARVRLQTERDLREKVDADQERRAQRRTEIPEERARATERLDALTAELAAGAGPDDPEAVATAKRWRTLAEQHLHRATLRALDEELRNYDVRRSVLDKRRAYRDRRIAVETRTVEEVQKAVSAKQVELAEQTEREAERQRREAASSHPIVQELLERNAEIAETNTQIVERKSADATARTQAESRLGEWRSAYERSRARVARAGRSNAIGYHLRSQRLRLPEPADLRRRMADRDGRISDLVNRSEDYWSDLEDLADVDRVADELMAGADGLPDDAAEREEIRKAVRDALLKQRELVSTLSGSINEYLDETLLELQNAERDLLELVIEYREFIDERILWIRSAPALEEEDLADARRAIVWALDRDGWSAVAASLKRDALAKPILYSVGLVVIGALLGVQRLLRRRLRWLAEQTRRYSSDSFVLTLRAMIVSVLIASALAAPLAFLGWRLSTAAGGQPLMEGLGLGLRRAAQTLFIAELVRVLCRPNGLGETHFRWRKPALRAIRHHLRWVTPIIVTLDFIVGLTMPRDDYVDSLGRMAYIASAMAFAIFLQRVLRPGGPLMRPIVAQHQGGWLERLRYVWYPLAVLAPLATAVVAGLGYLYSAVELHLRVVGTAWLLLAIIVGRAALLRALLLVQRRIDVEQRRKKLAAHIEETKRAAAAAESGGAPMKAPPAVESAGGAEEIDVAALSAQTRQLLNAVVVLSVIFGLALVWSDMLPALGVFQQIEIWTPEEVPAALASAEGTVAEGAAATVPLPSEAITLGHVLYSMLILVLTVLISKDIPGLLEIVLLQRLPISASGRYAATMIVRYVIVVVGLVLAFNAIGIGWSKVQWLAAAVTVGLGFGLQEIFANFVSGLIILFERPVRVGDTVTVGNVTGTVTQLRIRATTIRDWDRKELIVPNKEFVTGQIINWSLSDPILRIVVPVGVAYGSNTQLAEELLLQVARDDRSVLDEPKPMVVFEEFGDSSLNLTLRVFIPSIDDLLSTKHRLHNSIDRAFRDAGVTIAFPQLDVHMHEPSPRPEDAEPSG